MNTQKINELVEQCSRRGRSFRSVRREHGEDVYRQVRDECVRLGRGQIKLTMIGRAGGAIICKLA